VARKSKGSAFPSVYVALVHFAIYPLCVWRSRILITVENVPGSTRCSKSSPFWFLPGNLDYRRSCTAFYMCTVLFTLNVSYSGTLKTFFILNLSIFKKKSKFFMFQQYSTSSRNVMPHTFWAQAVKAVIVVLVLHYDAAPLHSLNSRQIRRSRYKVRTPTTDIWTTRCRPRGVQYTSDR
jgi:hypothetical protein